MFYFKTKNMGFFFSGILFIGIFIGIYNIAAHPNFNNWKEEKILITEVKTEEKVVCLTFDDGPDPTNTEYLLDILKKHNAKATFFVMGQRAEEHPMILQRMVNEGHEIGNHSYSHRDFNHKDDEYINNEINKANAIIYQITAQKPTLFRPPGGYLSYSMVDIVKKENLTIAYWTYQQDTKDWLGKGSNQIANHIIKNIKPGQIIILHDGTDNGLETAKAVDIIIEKLSKEEYKFITMTELIRIGNKE